MEIIHPTLSQQQIINDVLLCSPAQYSATLKQQLHAMQWQHYNTPVIYIGTGTCGRVAGAIQTLQRIKEYLTEKNINAQIIEVGCIGLCSSEPIVDIRLPGRARLSFGNIKEENVDQLFDAVLNHDIPSEYFIGQFTDDETEIWEGLPSIQAHPFFSHQHRIVLKSCGIINPESIDNYIASGGYIAFVKAIKQYPPENIIRMITESGLRGRGGGGFLTGKKWQTAFQTSADQKYIVANGDESDPGAFMDRALIEGNPHLLIEGLAIAAYAIGATKAYIYIRSDYHIAVKRLYQAIAQAKAYGLIDSNIFKSGVSFHVELRKSAGAFVCGEETALLQSIEGHRGTPQSKPPYPAVKGLFGKPTVVNNIETLANIPHILQQGPRNFLNIGVTGSSGTKVFALSGRIQHTGLVEIAMGTPLREIIFNIGGGIPNHKKFKAAQIGGPSGSCIPDEMLDIPVEFNTFQKANIIMGSGGLVIFDDTTCMVDVAKYFIAFLQRESCGKCIPCREGTRRMLEILNAITLRPKNETGHETLDRFKGIMQLESLAQIIKETSLCGLGQTAPNPVLSTLKYFRQEYEEHIFDRRCTAGVCISMRTYYINPDLCTGCTACAPKCPVQAIIGARRIPHFIIEDKCTGCGICYQTCKFVAINIK